METTIKQRNYFEVEKDLSQTLLKIGFRPHQLGFKYLKTAVILNTTHKYKNITSELYPAISGYYQISASNVERCIRHSIKVAFMKHSLLKLNELLEMPVIEDYCPTNSEMIGLLSENLHFKSCCQDLKSQLNLNNYEKNSF